MCGLEMTQTYILFILNGMLKILSQYLKLEGFI